MEDLSGNRQVEMALTFYCAETSFRHLKLSGVCQSKLTSQGLSGQKEVKFDVFGNKQDVCN